MTQPVFLIKSRYFAAFLVAVHSVPLIGLYALPWSGGVIAWVMGISMISFSVLWWRFVRRGVVEVWQDTRGMWGLKTVTGQILYGRVRNSSVVTSCLAVLNFRLDKQRRTLSVVIFPDAMSKNDF